MCVPLSKVIRLDMTNTVVYTKSQLAHIQWFVVLAWGRCREGPKVERLTPALTVSVGSAIVSLICDLPKGNLSTGQQGILFLIYFGSPIICAAAGHKDAGGCKSGWRYGLTGVS